MRVAVGGGFVILWLCLALAACGGAAQSSCLAITPNSYNAAAPNVTHGSKSCTTVASAVLDRVFLSDARPFAAAWQPGAIGWVTRVPCSSGGGSFTCHPHVREQTMAFNEDKERVVQYRTDVTCTGSGADMRCRLSGLKFEKVLYSGPTQNGEVTNP